MDSGSELRVKLVDLPCRASFELYAEVGWTAQSRTNGRLERDRPVTSEILVANSSDVHLIGHSNEE